MSNLEDTTELRRLATEDNRPDRNSLDYPLLGVAALVSVAALLWLAPVVDTDRWSVDGSRYIMAMALAALVVAAIFVNCYCLNRANRRRHEDLIARLDQMRAGVLYYAKVSSGGSDAWLVADRKTLQDTLDGVTDQQKDLAKRAFDTGRRVGRREAEG